MIAFLGAFSVGAKIPPGVSGGLKPVGTGGATGGVPGCAAGIPGSGLDGGFTGVFEGDFGIIKSSGDVAGGNSSFCGSVGCGAGGGGGGGSVCAAVVCGGSTATWSGWATGIAGVDIFGGGFKSFGDRAGGSSSTGLASACGVGAVGIAAGSTGGIGLPVLVGVVSFGVSI